MSVIITCLSVCPHLFIDHSSSLLSFVCVIFISITSAPNMSSAASSSTAAASTPTPIYDVIIVGAGPAGLAAALQLQKNGR